MRRTKSHFAGRLEFLTEAELTMHAGRSLDVITGASILHSEWERLVVPATFVAASVAAELIDAFSEPDLAQPEVYALLSAVVPALAAAGEPRALLPRFELRLLDALGIAPALDGCVRCGGSVETEAWLDPEAGGLLCPACHLRGDAGRLEAGDVANLRALAAPRGGPIPAVAAANPAVARAVDATVVYQLGKRARSAAFLDELAHAP
ncbi:MAG: DNA repair protein RecO C-terminal domain-containing protein [Candidatus Eremiobacteraeota bacterium]|nr:DNA repair protein RecO C-terminal domain-containing protein [Candidatus Eremiobacteraeota bacterium]